MRRLTALIAGGVVAGGMAATSCGGSSPAPTPSPSPSTPRPSSRPLTQTDQRVIDILQAMHVHGFNPQAGPKNHSTVNGGLFINWAAGWDGNLATAADNTNIGSNGKAGSVKNGIGAHDEYTDLLYLRNMLGYRASNPADHSFDGDISRLEPIVKAEFTGYTDIKCSLYGELRDLDRFEPGHGWDDLAHSYAEAVFSGSYDASAGVVAKNGSYRVDYAGECGTMMVEAGRRYGNSAMTAAGKSTIAHVISQAADPNTHLFPLQMTLSSGGDTVLQAQLKAGEEAQLLDAFLQAYDITGNTADLQAVVAATNELYSSSLGLHDTTHGGFYFSIDADGSHISRSYKETRQAWMLPLLEHLDRIQPGQWTSRVDEMLSVVRDKLWQATSGGYVFRTSVDFSIYHAHLNGATIVESWVTTEAMDIACQSLEGLPAAA